MAAVRQLGHSCRAIRRSAHAAAAIKPKGPTRPPSDADGDVKVLRKEQARIRVPGHGDRMVIGGIVFFDDASQRLTDEQKARLQIIAEELAGKPQEIEVLGHASPGRCRAGSSYQDRWDLAYARCRRTVELLGGLKIDPDRLRIGVVRDQHGRSRRCGRPGRGLPGRHLLDRTAAGEVHFDQCGAVRGISAAFSSPRPLGEGLAGSRALHRAAFSCTILFIPRGRGSRTIAVSGRHVDED